KYPKQEFFNLERYTNITLFVKNIDEALPPWSLSNRLKWFVERRFFKSVYPRLENYLIDNNFDYIFPETLSHRNDKVNVGSWIADFQYHHFPQGASKEVTASAERTISTIANNAKKVVLSSHYCEKDCLRLFPVTSGKTFVMPFSVALDSSVQQFSDFTSIREKYNLPAQFLMVANLFAPTKNHKTLFDAMGILRKRGMIVNLVCTGNIVDYRNLSFANDILQMLTNNQIRSQVHLLGLIPRSDQLALYRMAVALVQPSINEGWSTSVEEAKALGKNLLMSDIEVHQEQYPDNPYMFESLNANDMAEKMNNLWQKNINTVFPQLDAEKMALEAYQLKIKAFGNRFLEIASA
ncbi:MAG TPA: glycosyltransferase, partial [Cyclobacteriaceae bacterium]